MKLYPFLCCFVLWLLIDTEKHRKLKKKSVLFWRLQTGSSLFLHPVVGFREMVVVLGEKHRLERARGWSFLSLSTLSALFKDAEVESASGGFSCGGLWRGSGRVRGVCVRRWSREKLGVKMERVVRGGWVWQRPGVLPCC